MQLQNLFMKRALLALFLLLNTSCSECCRCWEGDCAAGIDAASSSARIYLCPANEFSGLELELVRTSCELRLYINVYGLEIPRDSCDPCTSKVYISFRDRSYSFSAQRFLGGQRLLIPPSTRDEIVESLYNDQPVFIQVGRYQADIYPDKFLEQYNRMMKAW